MKLSRTIYIPASPALVWAVTADVANWPDWTPTVARVRALDEDELHVGGRYALVQPMQGEAVWQVTRLEPGHLFAWEQRRNGRTLFTGTHKVEPAGAGSLATTALEAHFPFAGFLRPLFAGVLWSEGRSLRRRCGLYEQSRRDDLGDAPLQPSVESVFHSTR